MDGMRADRVIIDEITVTVTTTHRGTSNSNARGSSYARRSRRAWLIANYASDIPGLCRCYRCGHLLFNPDTPPEGAIDTTHQMLKMLVLRGRTRYVWGLTVDRIIPGCKGGTYRRNNIRPACGPCNSETGGALATRPRRTA